MGIAKQCGQWQRKIEVKGGRQRYIFSLAEKWHFSLPFKINPEEREFVVDSETSMHMISRKDLKFVELVIVMISRCRTTVITATGEVQTHEEATFHVRELDRFLTVQILEDTLGVFSLGKLCEDHGY